MNFGFHLQTTDILRYVHGSTFLTNCEFKCCVVVIEVSWCRASADLFTFKSDNCT